MFINKSRRNRIQATLRTCFFLLQVVSTLQVSPFSQLNPHFFQGQLRQRFPAAGWFGNTLLAPEVGLEQAGGIRECLHLPWLLRSRLRRVAKESAASYPITDRIEPVFQREFQEPKMELL